LNWLEDVDRNIFEVGISRNAPLSELPEGVANAVYDMFQLLHGQFGCYGFYDALCQLCDFGLHVEPQPHHIASFRCVSHYHAVRGLAPADASRSGSSE